MDTADRQNRIFRGDRPQTKPQEKENYINRDILRKPDTDDSDDFVVVNYLLSYVILIMEYTYRFFFFFF